MGYLAALFVPLALGVALYMLVWLVSALIFGLVATFLWGLGDGRDNII